MLRVILAVLMATGLVWLNHTDNIFAQSENSQEEWNSASAGPVTAWTAPLCGRASLVVQPFFFYNYTRGTFDSERHYDSLPAGDKKYQFQQQLFMQYGLSDRSEIDGQAVYQENYARQSGQSSHSEGFGDSYVFLRYCAMEESNIWPHLTGIFQLKLPTGKYQKADADKLGTDLMAAASGGGSYEHGYGAIFTKKIKPFILHLDAIYSFPQKVSVDGVKTKYGTYLTCDFGAEYFLPQGLNLMVECNGFLQGDKKEDGERVPSSDIRSLTLAPGIGWSNDKIQTLLVYQRTLAGTNTDANDSIVFTFVYTF